ncbi:hypothetical protein BJ165DRAFT_1182568 [Panaeolus papilionaceus]|nr:hypothetical protein BJ165DRAFT_1182568 [Panaeolus papilionaceus]
MCSLPECSVGAIAWGINTVTSGCQTEISDVLSGSRLLNGDPSTLSTIVTVAPSFYSAARKLACLWELGQNCAIKTATAFESFVEKPLSVPNLLATLKRLTSGRFIVRPGTPDGVVSPNNIIDTHDPTSGYGIYFDFDQAPTDLVCTSCVKAAFNSVKSDPLVSPLLGGIQPPLQDKCGAPFTDGGDVVGISNNSTAAPLNNPNNTGGSISIPATLNYGIFSAVAISSLTMILFKAL